jgi:hypothetical protein
VSLDNAFALIEGHPPRFEGTVVSVTEASKPAGGRNALLGSQ